MTQEEINQEQRREEQWEEMTLESANSKVFVRWQGNSSEAGDIVQDALESEQRRETMEQRHQDEYEMVHDGSGRSEELPSELEARHDREYKALEREIRGTENTKGDRNMSDKQTLNNEFLRDSYAIAQRRIAQLETWITEAIIKPSMSREMRLEGLEIVEAMNPSQSARLAVERICPTRTQGLEHTLEIER